jgi:hypothetical protein
MPLLRCRVPHCEKAMGSRKLLCSDHWSLVPDELKRAIWQEYRPHPLPGRETATPTYLRLAARAVRVATERDRNNDLDRDKHTGARKR